MLNFKDKCFVNTNIIKTNSWEAYCPQISTTEKKREDDGQKISLTRYPDIKIK